MAVEHVKMMETRGSFCFLSLFGKTDPCPDCLGSSKDDAEEENVKKLKLGRLTLPFSALPTYQNGHSTLDFPSQSFSFSHRSLRVNSKERKSQ